MADRGTAVERTGLAWQRTALSVLAGAAVLTRLTFGALGAWAFAVLVLAVPLVVWVLVESTIRSGRRPARDGVAGAALALSVVVLAGAELAALLRSG